MFFKKISSFVNPDIAIDLGTANIIVTLKDQGVIINEPSVVAIQTHKNSKKSVLAVGDEAKKMIGKTPKNIQAIRPMKDGVIADFDTTGLMISHFIQKVYRKSVFFKPRIIICIPSGVTQVEKKAVKEAAMVAGAKDVFLVEEPLAAAIGAGIPVSHANGHIVLDIGAGTTEMAVTSLGSLVLCSAIRTAGDSFDKAIVSYIKDTYSLTIGDEVAEKIKITIGTATKRKKELVMDVKGRDNFGYLKTIEVNSEEIRTALCEPLKNIASSLRKLIEQMPPDLAADVIDNGVTITGGGALLRGIDAYFSRIVKLPVTISEEPLLAVAKGSSEVLKSSDLLNLIDNI